MSMIEKVTKAIAEVEREGDYEDMAKAAIAAMMEPDMEILGKGLKAWHRNLGVEGQPDWSVMRKTWQAMIREALKE